MSAYPSPSTSCLNDSPVRIAGDSLKIQFSLSSSMADDGRHWDSNKVAGEAIAASLKTILGEPHIAHKSNIASLIHSPFHTHFISAQFGAKHTAIVSAKSWHILIDFFRQHSALWLLVLTSGSFTRPSWKEQLLGSWVQTCRYLHQWQRYGLSTQDKHLGIDKEEYESKNPGELKLGG